MDTGSLDVDGYTALGRAALYGDLKEVKLLLRQGADIELGEVKPLGAAAWNGHIETVQFLLQNGADINGLDAEDDTALGLAAVSGHLEVIKLLFSQGADLERGERKPLAHASSAGHIDVVEWVLNCGADVNDLDAYSNTAVGLAAEYGHLKVIKLLFSQGADIELGERKPLAHASAAGHIDVVEWLLDCGGADINGLNSDGNTALGVAAQHGHLDVVKLLLSRGADTELGKEKPLDAATRKGHTNIVHWLQQNVKSAKRPKPQKVLQSRHSDISTGSTRARSSASSQLQTKGKPEGKEEFLMYL